MKLASSLFAVALLWAALAAGADSKIKLPTSRADLLNGEKLFKIQCALCHGVTGEGGRGPSLTHATLMHAPDDAALVNVINNGIRGTEMPGSGVLSDKEVLQTAAFVRTLGKMVQKPVPGDAAHGAEIYRGQGGCAACHSIRGEGGIAGPDLSSIGEARSAPYLRESIVDPGAAVPEGYLLVTVTSKNGGPATGIRINEDSFSIQIRDSAGRSLSFWKGDLAKIDEQPGKSPMPSYKGKLTEPELTDLVAYLASC